MTVITMSRNELTRLRVLIDVADGRLSVADDRRRAGEGPMGAADLRALASLGSALDPKRSLMPTRDFGWTVPLPRAIVGS
jgi:hypothetical protein